MNDEEKLKPCPFCGGKARKETWSSGGMMYMICCDNPDCTKSIYTSSHNLKIAIEMWNRGKEKRNDSSTM